MKKIARRVFCMFLLIGALAAIAPTAALGTTMSDEKWYVRVYNVDDIGKVYVNGNLIRTVSYKGDTGWVDITSYVLGTAGDTKIRFTMYNKLQGYTWGFQIAKALPGQAKQIVWSKKAGTVGVSGANSNDQTKTNQTVYDATVYVKNLGSSCARSYTNKYTAFISDARWANGIAWNGSRTPKLSSESAWGCCAYTCDFCAYVFGKSGAGKCISTFSSFSSIRAGDVLKIHDISAPPDQYHWIVVLKRNGNTLYTAEGNYSSKVRIGNNYTISGSTLKSGNSTFTLTRGYHMQ